MCGGGGYSSREIGFRVYQGGGLLVRCAAASKLRGDSLFALQVLRTSRPKVFLKTEGLEILQTTCLRENLHKFFFTTLTGFKDLYLKATARIWHWLSCVCHTHSIAIGVITTAQRCAGVPRRARI